LVGEEPNDYVKRKYREAHEQRSLARGGHPSDSLLVPLARISPWNTKAIDTYARVFRRSSLVRKKLVLLLAILETCAPTYAYLDSPDPTSRAVFFLRSLQRGLMFSLICLIAAVVLFPLELMVRASAKLFVLSVPRHG
jgi:hypothetical protein